MKLNVKIMLQFMYGFTLSIVKKDKLVEEVTTQMEIAMI